MIRSFLLRFSLALVGMLLLCGTAYIGFGWVAWRHGEWLRPFFKDQTPENIRYYYQGVAIALFPGDMDGDGAMDGLEILWGTKLRVPESHDITIQRLDHPEFDAFDLRSHSTSFQSGTNAPYEFFLPRINQRLRVRGEVKFDGYREPLPRGFQVRVTARPHWLLALPGGKLQDSALIVPVTHEGRSGIVDFEIQPTEGAFASTESPTEISIDNPVTGMHLSNVEAKCLWPQPNLVLTTEDVPLNHAPVYVRDEGNPRVYRLQWPSAPLSAEAILVEAALDEDGAEWFPLSFYSVTDTVCFVVQHLWHSESPALGLKFRATPVRYSPEAGAVP